MKYKSILLKKVAPIGIGTVVGMFGLGGIANMVAGKVSGYDREVAGGTLTFLGIVMFGFARNRNVKNLALGIGALGFAYLVKGGYDRVKAQVGGSSSGSNDTSDSGSDSQYTPMPDLYAL